MEEKTVKDRVQEFLDQNGIPAARIERLTCQSNGSWKKTKNPSAGVIASILRLYPQLSAEYVMRGEGSITQHSDSVVINGDGNVNNQVNKMSERYIALLEKKDEQIDRLITLLEGKSR